MKKVIFVSFALLIAGCTTNAPTYVPVAPVAPNLAPIDSKLTEDCKPLTKLPDKDLSQVEAEKYWSIDRKNFSQCRIKHHGLADAVNFRDVLISPLTQKK